MFTPLNFVKKEIFIDRFVTDNIEGISSSEQRMIKRVSDGINQNRDIHKYYFLSNKLSLELPKSLIKNMIKHNFNGIYKGRLIFFS